MRSVAIIFSLLSILILSGCAATGANFMAVEAGPEDKSVVYFYRPKAYQGSAINYMIADNGVGLQSIKNGQFIRVLVEPGVHKFHTKTSAIDRAVELTTEAGKNYFFRVSQRMGMWVGSIELTPVMEEYAITEMKTCCKDGK